MQEHHCQAQCLAFSAAAGLLAVVGDSSRAPHQLSVSVWQLLKGRDSPHCVCTWGNKPRSFWQAWSSKGKVQVSAAFNADGHRLLICRSGLPPLIFGMQVGKAYIHAVHAAISKQIIRLPLSSSSGKDICSH